MLGACSSVNRGEQACLNALSKRGIVYEKVADWGTSKGCGVAWAVKVSRSATSWNNPATMSCPLALKIWDFETKVVGPAAREIFNKPVSQMYNYGSYACRNTIGTRVARLSEHAKGRAFDVGEFQLSDGSRISISKDWKDSGPKGRFLRRIAKEACSVFPVVLSPNYNKAHKDHLHLDLSSRLCGV